MQLKGQNWPKNQDRRYRGTITVMKAVEISNNAVAAKVVDMISPQRSFDFATKKLGLTTLISYLEQNGSTFSDIDIAPMALGALTNGVTVEDMAASYAAFTNKGVYNEPRTYTRIEDSNGNLVLDNTTESRVAMQEKTAYYMNEILQSVVTRGTGTKAKLQNMPTAGKTGTTDDDYDRWFVGYTPYYTAAVWFGYDTPQEISLKSSLNPALDLWRQVMSRVHENLESRDFFEYPDIVKASYCTVTGKRPSSFCTSAVGYYASGDQPSEVCTGHDGVEWGDMSPSPSPSESESPSASPPSTVTETPTVTPTVPVTEPPATNTPTTPPTTDPSAVSTPPVVTPQPPTTNPEG